MEIGKKKKTARRKLFERMKIIQNRFSKTRLIA
jgi:hypothetical protein